MDYLANFKPQFSNNYELIRWVIFVFLGASLSAVAFQLIGGFFIALPNEIQSQQYYVGSLSHTLDIQANQTLHTQTQKLLTDAQQVLSLYYVRLLLLPVTLFLIPIAISLVLTRAHPDKQIVPPWYMQLIVVAYYVFYALFHAEPTEIQQSVSLFMLVFVYTIIVPQVQDKVVVWVTGYTVHGDDMLSFSLKTRTKLEKIEEILTKESFRKKLGILATPEETDRGVELKTLKFSRFSIVIELERIKNDEKDETFINVVFFEKGPYYFKHSEVLNEFAIEKMEYLKNILSRTENLVDFEEVSNNNAEHLKNSILDDTKGVYHHIGAVTKQGAFKIALFCIAIGIACGFFFVIKDNTNGFVTLAIILLYLAFELPQRLVEKRRKK